MPETVIRSDPAEVRAALETYRTELTGYCYRMLGGSLDAEDAVQETLVRAWRAADRFEGRSTLRTWLYRIATNVCLDALEGRERRARPVDLGPATDRPAHPGAELPEAAWLEPVPDARVLPRDGDPAEIAVARDTIRLAFVAALQLLPPRQRAVLLLREVLRWRASEVASLLGTSVASVNSALQRARATLDAHGTAAGEAHDPLDRAQQLLLDRYVDAFERYDLDAFTALLHEDATQSMPPYALWIHGRDQVVDWMAGPGAGCRGSRLLPTVANGSPAFGQYRPSPSGTGHEAWALQVLEIVDGRIVAQQSFLDVGRWFPLFGLPLTLEA